MSVTIPATRDSTARRARPWPVVAATELAIAIGVLVAYRAGRLVTNRSAEAAQRNADRVINFERTLGIYTEQSIQRAVLDAGWAVELLNRYYVVVHFPATTAFLVWTFARHRHRYRAIRNWFTIVTMLALIIHVAFPLAPPRMRPGFVDTLDVFGPSIYPQDPGSSVANQFAAMPSLHFGWALMVAIGIAASTERHRLVWMLHPILTLLAIVATANHYWTDAAIAALLVGLAGAVIVRHRRGDGDRRTVAVDRYVPTSIVRRSWPTVSRPS